LRAARAIKNQPHAIKNMFLKAIGSKIRYHLQLDLTYASSPNEYGGEFFSSKGSASVSAKKKASIPHLGAETAQIQLIDFGISFKTFGSKGATPESAIEYTIASPVTIILITSAENTKEVVYPIGYTFKYSISTIK
jgi:hypothetical protein